MKVAYKSGQYTQNLGRMGDHSSQKNKPGQRTGTTAAPGAALHAGFGSSSRACLHGGQNFPFHLYCRRKPRTSLSGLSSICCDFSVSLRSSGVMPSSRSARPLSFPLSFFLSFLLPPLCAVYVEHLVLKVSQFLNILECSWDLNINSCLLRRTTRLENIPWNWVLK